jgi:hypothetical protein
MSTPVESIQLGFSRARGKVCNYPPPRRPGEIIILDGQFLADPENRVSLTTVKRFRIDGQSPFGLPEETALPTTLVIKIIPFNGGGFRDSCFDGSDLSRDASVIRGGVAPRLHWIPPADGALPLRAFVP